MFGFKGCEDWESGNPEPSVEGLGFRGSEDWEDGHFQGLGLRGSEDWVSDIDSRVPSGSAGMAVRVHSRLVRVDLVEHFVGLVEDEGLDVARAQVAPPDHVKHTAGGARHNVHSVVQLPDVIPDALAADARVRLDLHVVADGKNDLLCLRGESVAVIAFDHNPLHATPVSPTPAQMRREKGCERIKNSGVDGVWWYLVCKLPGGVHDQNLYLPLRRVDELESRDRKHRCLSRACTPSTTPRIPSQQVRASWRGKEKGGLDVGGFRGWGRRRVLRYMCGITDQTAIEQ